MHNFTPGRVLFFFLVLSMGALVCLWSIRKKLWDELAKLYQPLPEMPAEPELVDAKIKSFFGDSYLIRLLHSPQKEGMCLTLRAPWNFTIGPAAIVVPWSELEVEHFSYDESYPILVVTLKKYPSLKLYIFGPAADAFVSVMEKKPKRLT